MDCNKDEAIRAKELAEKKLAEMDASGAKRFALKAQNLYPELDGLPQLLATLDIYIAADKKINGETDWYGLLGVQPSAGEDTIRKHYKKLALILHPDKNKSVGAEGAFKVLSEAWNLLSDKEKRVAYDQKRNLRATYTSVFNGKASSSVATSKKGFRNFSNSNIPNTSDQSGSSYSRSAPPHSASRTFWTSCDSCKMHFEYSREYVNMNLTCTNCCTPFFSVEKPAPTMNGNSRYIPLTDPMQRQKFCQSLNKGGGRFSGLHSSSKDFQKGAFSRSGSNMNMAPPTSSTAQPAGVAHLASETLKSEHKEPQSGTIKEESPFVNVRPSQKANTGSAARSSGSVSNFAAKKHRPKKRRLHEREKRNHVAMGNEGVEISSSEKSGLEAGKRNIDGISRPNFMKEPSQPKMQDILMEMARKEIIKKINPGNSASLSNSSNNTKASDKGMDVKDDGNGKDAPSMKPDGPQSREFKDINSSIQPKKPYTVEADVDPATNEPDPTSMNVPDPDFHDFDKDRTEKSFGENQVWAAYDDDDGMPRYYAMIHSVISLKPFQMKMSWLNSKSNTELAPLNWIGSGFYKTSGDFWTGKHVLNRSLNSFSHKVKWSKGRKGVIQIYPRKGDVWALYRNWSSDWNELTPDEVIHKYDMVEVLEDYNEQKGVAIAPLVKVPGFKTVFQKHSKSSITWMVPKEELFRFSHQVPSYLLTGQEGPNAPKGCLELDPAATPLELLQVFTEAQVTEMEVIFERALGESVLGESDQTKGVEQAVTEEEINGETGSKNTGVLVYNRRKRRKQES